MTVSIQLWYGASHLCLFLHVLLEHTHINMDLDLNIHTTGTSSLVLASYFNTTKKNPKYFSQTQRALVISHIVAH